MTSTPLETHTDSSDNAPRIAWIGLGNLGRAMAHLIVEKAAFKDPALIYNRTRSVADDFVASRQRAKVAESIEECVRDADIIFTNVSNDDAVRGIVESALAAVPNGGGGKKLFVDMSTIHPKTTDEIADMVRKAGQRFVAGPVFGTPDVAEQGRLVVALAGEEEDIERVRPFCKDIIAREELLYPSQPPSIATTLKIVGNTFVFHVVESLSEAHVLAQKSGLGAANLHALIETMYPGPMTAYSTRMMDGDYFKSVKWGAELALKDYAHARSLAEEFGVVTRGLDVVAGHVRDVRGWAEGAEGRVGDIAGVYGVVRREAGLEFEDAV